MDFIYRKSVGDTLRDLMVEKRPKGSPRKWTQRRLAIECGVHSDTINNWINGRTLPGAWYLNRLADCMGLTENEREVLFARRFGNSNLRRVGNAQTRTVSVIMKWE
jgi:transcriptional regulator with XRE-family HTH domain